MMVMMKTIMRLEDLKTIDQLSEFLSGTQAVAFSIILDKDDCYRWIQAAMDERHDTPCGPAVKKLCERAFEVFGQMDMPHLHQYL